MSEYQNNIYKKLPYPILVVSPDLKVVYANYFFIEIFGNFTSIKKLQYNFSFDICVLDHTKITKYNPLAEAVDSAVDFSAYITFQSHKQDVKYFDFSAFKDGKNTVMMFKEYTEQINNKKLQTRLDKINSELKNSQVQHKQFVKLEQTAREHAIKMSLLNKISHQIRNSIHVDLIIKTALVELLSMTNGFKAYWAIPENDNFIVKQVYPNEFKEMENTNIEFDHNVTRTIFSKKHDITTCFKEYKNTDEEYKTPVHRVIIPVYSQNDFFGIIVMLTKQKNDIKQIVEIFQSISTQIAAQIKQASLFEQLNDKNKELEETLEELKNTQIQLINSEKMASLGHLIAGVAHEINTPIGSINSNNTILEKIIQKLEQQNLQNLYHVEMLKNINNIDKEAIKRISKIVSSLKKFVRLDEAEQQETNINNELDLTLDLIRHETKNRITINKNYGNIPFVKCYTNMLNQVFMNILMNAIQSITDKGEITITTTHTKNEVHISIKDTGCGMDEKTIQKIFTPGFTTKGVGIGTGIGLAITYKIVEKHNGKIDVFSVPNKGSEFVIKLPIS